MEVLYNIGQKYIISKARGLESTLNYRHHDEMTVHWTRRPLTTAYVRTRVVHVCCVESPTDTRRPHVVLLPVHQGDKRSHLSLAHCQALIN